tara:strand:+ start:1645 stop:2856 length:1212 start_codon:yes stop_codon:yes gene_type:complete
MEQLCYLKDIISDTEKRLSLIKENKENLDSKLIELYELRKNCCSHFQFQKDLIFKDILKKYKNKKQLLDFLNSLFERIDVIIFDVNVDLNNINFTIFDNQIENIKKDICFYNSEKKIKLKELEMVKKYLNGLSVYKQFKRDFTNSVFDQYYTKNRNKILKNLGNTSFIKQYINDKYYKLKFSRCLLKDEFQYKEYQKEEECIKNSLIELELNIIEQQNLLDNLNRAKKKLVNLKNEDFFIKELNSFFIENFDIEHAKLINNKKFNKYYFNYKVISLILNNLKNEILLLDNFYNKKWKFFKKIRCFQYTQKYKSFEFKKDQIESEIIQYIENLYNQYKICKKIININLDIIDQVHINNEQDFLLFLHDEFQLNVHDSFNIKNNEKEDFINIFKNNIMHFNYIKF